METDSQVSATFALPGYVETASLVKHWREQGRYAYADRSVC